MKRKRYPIQIQKIPNIRPDWTPKSGPVHHCRGGRLPEWTPAGVWILGWTRSWSQYFRFEQEPKSIFKVFAGAN